MTDLLSAPARIAGRRLRGLRVAVLERPHRAGHRGALVDALVPVLTDLGAVVTVVDADRGVVRLDARPPWDLVLLKSGSTAAVHLAAAAEAWGVPCLNTSAATRVTRDKLASTAVLARAGLPLPRSWGLWLDGDPAAVDPVLAAGEVSRLVVKAARGSQGAGIRWANAAALPALVPALPTGPYLVMENVPRDGDDLKVFVVGDWMDAIRRPFPATSYEEKLGRPWLLDADVARTVRRVGELLGLDCYGCDFVDGPDGWTLVDVNAFPGYKGVDPVPALLDLIELLARQGSGRP